MNQVVKALFTAMASSSRSISKVVPARPGFPVRMVGTLDIDGKGTQHELEEVDPFILLDKVTMKESGMPPFGAHPHKGHSVVTLLLRGTEKSWDSLKNEEFTFNAPASCLADAGSGMFHYEISDVENESDFSQRVGLLQLWIGIKEADRSKPPRIQLDDKLPLEDLLDASGSKVGTIRHFLGEKTSIETLHPVEVALVHQNPGSTVRIPINPSFGGMVINLNGSDMLDDSSPPEKSASFAGVRPKGTDDILVLGNDDGSDADFLEVTTLGDASGDYMVCVGEQMAEPWYKKLVANGAVFADSKEKARALAKELEASSVAGKSGGSFAPFGI